MRVVLILLALSIVAANADERPLWTGNGGTCERIEDLTAIFDAIATHGEVAGVAMMHAINTREQRIRATLSASNSNRSPRPWRPRPTATVGSTSTASTSRGVE
jgi:hypothetical protein